MTAPEATRQVHGSRLELINLRKSFGKTMAVDEVSLVVEPGQFVTLLGPSGSGKTTTLMMIAGFEEPDAGAIRLGGRDITYVPTHERAIGVVFQNYALFPHMTVFENIAFSLRMRGVPSREMSARIDEALALVKLSGYAPRYPRQLSGGQQQRVALARALVFKPSLLLLDEPLGALDRLLREHMQLELRRLHEQLDMTMVYVTHDQEEALVLSDKIAIMNEGRIAQLDRPDAVYERPANRFVAGFVGHSNFLRGRIAVVDGAGGGLASVGELKIRVTGVGAFAENEDVEVAIRPEKIVLGTEGMRSSEQYQATVEDSIYLGEAMKYTVRLARDAILVVKQQLRAGSPRFCRGDRVVAGWDLQDVRVARAGRAEPDA
jgi:spermidine/putrescine ABC transporter ATP-binding subunit